MEEQKENEAAGPRRRGRRPRVVVTRVEHFFSHSLVRAWDPNLGPCVLARAAVRHGVEFRPARPPFHNPGKRMPWPKVRSLIRPDLTADWVKLPWGLRYWPKPPRPEPDPAAARPDRPLYEFLIPDALRADLRAEADDLGHVLQESGDPGAGVLRPGEDELAAPGPALRPLLEAVARHPRGLVEVADDDQEFAALTALCVFFRAGDVLVSLRRARGPSPEEFAGWATAGGLPFEAVEASRPDFWGVDGAAPAGPPRRVVAWSVVGDGWGAGLGRTVWVSTVASGACQCPGRLFGPGAARCYALVRGFAGRMTAERVDLIRAFGTVIHRTTPGPPPGG